MRELQVIIFLKGKRIKQFAPKSKKIFVIQGVLKKTRQ